MMMGKKEKTAALGIDSTQECFDDFSPLFWFVFMRSGFCFVSDRPHLEDLQVDTLDLCGTKQSKEACAKKAWGSNF